MSKYIYLLILCLISSGRLVAQDSSSGIMLRSSVVAESNEPLEFVQVVLFDTKDSLHAVQSTLTDSLGKFELRYVPIGDYVIRVRALGYAPVTSGPIKLTSSSEIQQHAPIRMQADKQSLGEVVVTGERPAVERTRGKMSLNIGNSFFRTAPNALEVLRRAPGVHVDPSGGITVRQGVVPIVYIDGKQIPVTTEQLLSLPTEDLEQVEVITNADARYDGETRAVINIRLKRDTNLGIKGNYYLGSSANQYYLGYDFGISSTYKTPKWAHYARMGYFESNGFLKAVANRQIIESSETSLFESTSFARLRARPLSYQYGADYSLSKTNTVGLVLQGSDSRRLDETDNVTELRVLRRGQTGYLNRLPSNSLSNSHSNNLAIDLTYSGDFGAKGGKLRSAINHINYKTQQNQDFRVDFTGTTNNELRFPSTLLGNFGTTSPVSPLTYRLVSR
jgi:hypothetical protein